MPVSFQNVSYIYNEKTPFSLKALDGISLEMDEAKFIALVGKTGSGKSTLIQLINALLHPTEGVVDAYGFKNAPKKKERSKDWKSLRKTVGLVFQFPEYQLFEDTVEKDVSFGPKNFGMKKQEAIEAAHQALEKVGLDSSFYDRSPFELSGGEKRKVAIAGILATAPKLLILDEPTAGLDPQASEEMMDLLLRLKSEGTSLILVPHDMDLVARYCDEVVVLSDGKIAKQCSPKELFLSPMEEYSLCSPMMETFLRNLKKKGLSLSGDIHDERSFASAYAKKVRHG